MTKMMMRFHQFDSGRGEGALDAVPVPFFFFSFPFFLSFFYYHHHFDARLDGPFVGSALREGPRRGRRIGSSFDIDRDRKSIEMSRFFFVDFIRFG